MIFSNAEIYNIAVKAGVFYKDKSTHFPVKPGFYLYKNLRMFTEAAQDIDEAKRNIINQYSATPEDEEYYTIAKEDQIAVQKELAELSKLTQDIPLYPLKIEDFEDTKLTGEQVEILTSMIEIPKEIEEEEE